MKIEETLGEKYVHWTILLGVLIIETLRGGSFKQIMIMSFMDIIIFLLVAMFIGGSFKSNKDKFLA